MCTVSGTTHIHLGHLQEQFIGPESWPTGAARSLWILSWLWVFWKSQGHSSQFPIQLRVLGKVFSSLKFPTALLYWTSMLWIWHFNLWNDVVPLQIPRWQERGMLSFNHCPLCGRNSSAPNSHHPMFSFIWRYFLSYLWLASHHLLSSLLPKFLSIFSTFLFISNFSTTSLLFSLIDFKINTVLAFLKLIHYS